MAQLSRSPDALPDGDVDTPVPEADRKSGDWQIYKRLLGYVKPYSLMFGVAVIAFLFGSAAEAYFAQLLGDLIDTWGTEDLSAALMIPVAMFLAALVRASGAIVGESLLSRVSFNVVYNLRVQLFDQLLEMPSRYYDASTQGHLVSRLTFNVAQLRDTGTDALRSIVQDGGKVIVYFGWMLYLSWQLTMVFVAAAPVLALVVMFASRRFRRISRRIQNSMGDVTHVAGEAVSGYRAVKIYGGEHYEKTRFHRASRINRQQSMKMAVTKVFSAQVNEVLVAAALAGLVVLLFETGIGSDMSKGDVVTFLGLAGLLARPIRKLSEVNAKLQRGLAAAEDVFGQLDELIERDEGTHTAARVRGEISFDNVAFRYERGKEAVLRQISLYIEPGQTVALVGRSGSGKSTIASLIPRFYDVEEGVILLDGTPLSDYTLRSLRDQIALVSQQVTLFNDTLKKNIAYGQLAEMDESQIEDAIDRAHVREFVGDLEDGLETIVGDDGVLLSGGQRQRVAIARALLKDAPILILDEATSALDTESERHIQAALSEVMKGRTTIVIAHRLSTIESADLIVVVEEGRIVEQGDHETLLNNKGAYAALYQAQFEDDALPAKPRALRKPAARKVPSAQPLPKTVRWFESAWYENAWWGIVLRPFAWLFGRLARRRRQAYQLQERPSWRAPVPVVVVGNITAGGTGKTPVVESLARWLKEAGFKPGIVSRGFGGSSDEIQAVYPHSDPHMVGDEPVLLARRLAIPVYVGADRPAAVQALLAAESCNVVLSDDGLQHYALARDVEIAVVDGQRGLGNSQLLPAGPLREPAERLAEVDLIISNGDGFAGADVIVNLAPTRFVRLSDRESLPLDAFATGCNVHAVAGVGNPTRFFRSLQALGLHVDAHALADHHVFSGDELRFEDTNPIIVTEKDAVKIINLDVDLSNVYYLEVAIEFDEPLSAAFKRLFSEHGIRVAA